MYKAKLRIYTKGIGKMRKQLPIRLHVYEENYKQIGEPKEKCSVVEFHSKASDNVVLVSRSIKTTILAFSLA